MVRTVICFALILLTGCGGETPAPIDSDETFKQVKEWFRVQKAEGYGVDKYPEGQRFKLIVYNGQYFGGYVAKQSGSWDLLKKDFIDATNYSGAASCCSSRISFRNPEAVPPGLGVKFRRVFIDAAWAGEPNSDPRFVDAIVESFDDE